MTQQQNQILRLFILRYPKFTYAYQLVEEIYGGTLAGGPDDPNATIKVQINGLNRVIGEYGWVIKAASSHHARRLEQVRR